MVDQDFQDIIRVEELKGASATQHSEEVQSSPAPPRQPYLKRLAPVQGVYTESSLLKLVLSPLGTLAHPGAVWAVITLAFPVLWLVAILFVIAAIFSAPPYSLDPTQIGYLSAGRESTLLLDPSNRLTVLPLSYCHWFPCLRYSWSSL